ncbi:hypothetical protein C8F01DRAFT_178740 [Mycena amicta]|nr:hypothetical protein C8F01DRAFT_178740 [Mycena amicta]
MDSCLTCRKQPALPPYTRCSLCRNGNVLGTSTAQNMPVPQKRKAADSDDEIEDSSLAMARLRKRMKLMALPPAPAVVTTKTKRTKFVVADALYKAVAQESRTSPVEFAGTFAIIANPQVDNERRARLVARELRRAATLQYNIDDGTPAHSSGATHRFTILLKCTCHTGRPFVKPKSRDLFAYFTSKPKRSAPASQPTQNASSQATICEGHTIISAEDDNSHPLGWLGQRIKVTVKHPKA